MSDLPDYYSVLGVAPASEDVVIRAAYRALMLKYHPDKVGKSGGSDRASQINLAYEALSDPQRRKVYDQEIASQSTDKSKLYENFVHRSAESNCEDDSTDIDYSNSFSDEMEFGTNSVFAEAGLASKVVGIIIVCGLLLVVYFFVFGPLGFLLRSSDASAPPAAAVDGLPWSLESNVQGFKIAKLKIIPHIFSKDSEDPSPQCSYAYTVPDGGVRLAAAKAGWLVGPERTFSGLSFVIIARSYSFTRGACTAVDGNILIYNRSGLLVDLYTSKSSGKYINGLLQNSGGIYVEQGPSITLAGHFEIADHVISFSTNEKANPTNDGVDQSDASRSEDGDAASSNELTLAAAPTTSRYLGSVFGNGNSGTLACSFVGMAPFAVKWTTDDANGTIKVNGSSVKGKVVGDWEPGPNKVRYDITIDPDAKIGLPEISISDDGEISDAQGHKGTCQAAD